VNIQIVRLAPSLKDYVDQIFVFNSNGRLASDDLKLIVPNGRIKLIIPIQNSIVGKIGSHVHVSDTYKITLAGLADMPAEVDIVNNEPAGNITVEFSPAGAYRFFNLKLGEVKNQIYNCSDISHKLITELEDKIAHAPTLPGKVKIVQQFLITQLHRSPDDPIFDFCIRKIIGSKGRISVKELEKATGYSSRWLNMKFTEKLGASPKNIASIIRFQQYYKTLATNSDLFFLERDFYNYYYDQSHFIKDFKRFTGYAPVHFEKQRNDYDHIFYSC
jgi:AraC-like DNA-binding protein